MVEVSYKAIVSFLLAVFGFMFCLIFQGMGYWGPGGFSWVGYLTGAGLAYILSLGSIILMVSNKKFFISFPLLTIINTMAIIASFLWTTFVIIAGMSGM